MKRIVSIIPKRETCDTCEYSEPINDEWPYYCRRQNIKVSGKYWCGNYRRLSAIATNPEPEFTNMGDKEQ